MNKKNLISLFMYEISSFCFILECLGEDNIYKIKTINDELLQNKDKEYKTLILDSKNKDLKTLIKESNESVLLEQYNEFLKIKFNVILDFILKYKKEIDKDLVENVKNIDRCSFHYRTSIENYFLNIINNFTKVFYRVPEYLNSNFDKLYKIIEDLTGVDITNQISPNKLNEEVLTYATYNHDLIKTFKPIQEKLKNDKEIFEYKYSMLKDLNEKEDSKELLDYLLYNDDFYHYFDFIDEDTCKLLQERFNNLHNVIINKKFNKWKQDNKNLLDNLIGKIFIDPQTDYYEKYYKILTVNSTEDLYNLDEINYVECSIYNTELINHITTPKKHDEIPINLLKYKPDTIKDYSIKKNSIYELIYKSNLKECSQEELPSQVQHLFNVIEAYV